MDFIADILMVAGNFGVAVYCLVLSRRLKAFATLESGMGGAVAVLSAQVDDLTRALDQARKTAADSAQTLTDLTGRANTAASRLELMLASTHDLPHQGAATGENQHEYRKLRFTRRRTSANNLSEFD